MLRRLVTGLLRLRPSMTLRHRPNLPWLRALVDTLRQRIVTCLYFLTESLLGMSQIKN